MAKLESLVVDLQVESAKLRKGLDDANAKLKSFGDRLTSIGKTVSNTIGVALAKDAVVGLAQFVQKGAETADAMVKLAAASGVPVENLSRLGYAADFSGVSTEELGGALAKLNKGMAEAAAGSAEQAAVFDALGIHIKDAAGALRTADSVLVDVAEKFSGLEDGTAKAALAQELFGKSGAKLIPLLNSGRDGLQQMADEADRFGFTVNAAGGAAAEQFNDALLRMKKSTEGLAVRVAQDLAPSFASLVNQFTDTTSGSKQLDDAAKVLATTMRLLASGATIAAGVFEVVGLHIAQVASAAANLAQGDFRAAWESVKAGNEKMLESAKQTKARLDAIWTDGKGGGELVGPPAPPKASADPILKHFERRKKAIQEAAKAEKEANKQALESLRMYEEYLQAAVDHEAELARQRREEHAKARDRGLPGSGRFGGSTIPGQEMQTAAARIDKGPLERLRASSYQFAQNFSSTMETAGQIILSAAMTAAPKFGAMMQGAMQGAQSGGIWGAIAGAIAGLLTQTRAFGAVMKQVEEGMSVLVNILEPVLKPLLTLNVLANGFLKVLVQLSAIGPVLDLIGRGFFELFKGVGMGMMDLILGLKDLWNGIVTAVQQVLYSVGDVFKDVMPALRDAFFLAAAGMQSWKATAAGLQAEREKLSQMHWETILDELEPPTKNLGDGMRDATEQVKRYTEAITNAPSGFRVNAARYAAQTPRGWEPDTPVVNVFIGADQVAGTVKRIERTNRFRISGSPG